MPGIRIEKAFCASPSDLNEERDAFRRCIDEYNRLWSDTNSIRFDPVMWEYDTYSAIGSDPQKVISNQIGDNYHLLVGLMWTKFGTPTPRAGSGTEEELHDAIKRWKQHDASVGIMFFFKDAPVYISELDAEQIYKVLKFKAALKQDGILFHHFGGRDKRGFDEVFRQSLTLYARNRAEKYKKQSMQSPPDFRYVGEILKILSRF